MTKPPTPPGGVIDGQRHLFALRAYYEDTDLSGIVYHANYLRWFERARSDLLRVLQIDQRTAIEEGLGAYAVVELNIRYLSPARLDDDILIETCCTRLSAASLRMRQSARRGDQLLAEMDSRIGFISPDGKPRAQPKHWRDIYRPLICEESQT